MSREDNGRLFNLLAMDRSRRQASLTAMSSRRQLTHVAVLSALGLFCELLLIRWLDAEIRPLAYVKNLPLIASFLGLGIGFSLAGRKRSTFSLSVLLLSLVLTVGVLSADRLGESLTGPAGPEINLGIDATGDAGDLAVFYLLIVAIFALVVIALVPLGQIAGEYMEGLPPLPCYSANVGGALAGIVAFFLLAVFSIPPWVGALLVFAVCLAYLQQPWVRAFSAGLALLTCFGMAAIDYSGNTVWTPYNKIKVSQLPPVQTPQGEVEIGWVLEVQNIYYQRLLDLRPETVRAVQKQAPLIAQAYYHYSYPYTWTKPRRVLVVGAGTGNDVAMALRYGVEQVDAVEIDPRILRFGRELHPEHPYDDPRVRLIEADAREFLKRGGEPYDLIVFGLLDSHTSLYSSLSSNIRLDNYVYTVEAMAEALERLSSDGILAMSFYAQQPWIVTRLDAMLRQVLDKPPLVTQILYDGGYLYLGGPGVPDDPGDRPEVLVGVPDQIYQEHPPGPSATDDWPFLYLAKKGVPAVVLQASLGMLVATILLVGVFFRRQVSFDRHLFFLGAGFLLVETRTIAQLGLLFGSTWRVSAITIAGILIMILLANMLIARRGAMAPLPLYLALGLSLLANYLVPVGWALGGGLPASVGMAIFCLLPLFFAALIFASSVSRLKGLAAPLASNLIGSVFGGLLENLAMWVGISALSLIALVVYACSYRPYKR